MPQPYFVPVRPTCSRITHSSGVFGSTSTLCDCPLMVRATMFEPPCSPVGELVVANSRAKRSCWRGFSQARVRARLAASDESRASQFRERERCRRMAAAIRTGIVYNGGMRVEAAGTAPRSLVQPLAAARGFIDQRDVVRDRGIARILGLRLGEFEPCT